MKEYLADGVYAEWDGQQLKITTENGIETTNEIYLEPYTYASLVSYWKRVVMGGSDTSTEPTEGSNG